MININLIKPSKDNLKLNLIIGLSLVFLSLFDVFLYSFFEVNLTSFLPFALSFSLPLLLGMFGLHLIRIEYSGIKNLDNLNKNINTNNFNAALTLIIIFMIIKVLPPVTNWMILDANISGDTKDACTGSGACWTYIKIWFKRFMYGMYPNEHIWRVNLAFIFLVALAFVGFFTPEKYKKFLTLYYVIIYPIIAYILIYYLISGGSLGFFFDLANGDIKINMYNDNGKVSIIKN